MHSAPEIIAMTPEEKWAKLEALMAERYGYPDKRGAPGKLANDIGRHANTFYHWRADPKMIDPLAIIALQLMTAQDQERQALQRRLLADVADDMAATATQLSEVAVKLSALASDLRS